MQRDEKKQSIVSMAVARLELKFAPEKKKKDWIKACSE